MRIFSVILAILLVSSPVNAITQSEVQGSSIEKDMVHIPAGIFTRGCNSFGPQHGAPEHKVYLDAYMIDKYEVTNIKYDAVIPEHTLRRSIFSDCDQCPVSKISWYEAADYCHLVGKSLPSEAQWERAAGGDMGCEFPWGAAFDAGKNQAHGGLKLKDNAAPVGSYPPNKLGIYDMAGNMWEWVGDWLHFPYFHREILYNPRGPNSGVMKVRRGGAWSDSVKAMSTGYRDWSYPFSRGFNDIGFRCAINFRKKD